MACLEVILQNGTFGRDQAHVCREIHAAVWQLPDKALVNLQRTSYCVEEACRIDEVFVFAAYRVRDFDKAVHGSEDIKVYCAAEARTAALTGAYLLMSATSWASRDTFRPFAPAASGIFDGFDDHAEDGKACTLDVSSLGADE
jgi:hypothetical protein